MPNYYSQVHECREAVCAELFTVHARREVVCTELSTVLRVGSCLRRVLLPTMVGGAVCAECCCLPRRLVGRHMPVITYGYARREAYAR